MALLIKATQTNPITITGTDITLQSVYGRIAFACKQDGVNLEAFVTTYASEASYEENKLIYTSIPMGNINGQIEAGEVQGLEAAHSLCKKAYEELGYEVEILLAL